MAAYTSRGFGARVGKNLQLLSRRMEGGQQGGPERSAGAIPSQRPKCWWAAIYGVPELQICVCVDSTQVQQQVRAADICVLRSLSDGLVRVRMSSADPNARALLAR